MSQLRDHLMLINNTMRQCYPGVPKRTMQEIVMEFGRNFTPALRPEGLRKMPDKECFCNATKLILHDPGFIYVEGFALPDGIPLAVHHAWVMDQDGNMIDPTWETAGVEYLGVPFDHQYHLEVMIKTEMYGILDNWHWREIYDQDPSVYLYKGDV